MLIDPPDSDLQGSDLIIHPQYEIRAIALLRALNRLSLLGLENAHTILEDAATARAYSPPGGAVQGDLEQKEQCKTRILGEVKAVQNGHL